MIEKDEEDRLSQLPDCLLLEILSCLPSTKEAIKTGTLCKRWKDLWTLVSTLIFIKDVKLTPSDFVSFVDLTLTQCRQVKLKKFLVFATFYYGFKRQVNKWIRYAITCKVENLCLGLYSGGVDGFPLDQSLFINTCFTHVTLGGCMLNPLGAISWKNLRNLCIRYGDLNEDLTENILSGSTLLETLVLEYCYVKYRLNITSKRIKNLDLNYSHGWGRSDFDFAEVTAPNILSLTIKGQSFLYDFLLVNMSSLVEVSLACNNATPIKVEEDELKRFIMNLRHVKELKIGSLCSKVLSSLEAKGFVLPSNIKLPDAF